MHQCITAKLQKCPDCGKMKAGRFYTDNRPHQHSIRQICDACYHKQKYSQVVRCTDCGEKKSGRFYTDNRPDHQGLVGKICSACHHLHQYSQLRKSAYKYSDSNRHYYSKHGPATPLDPPMTAPETSRMPIMPQESPAYSQPSPSTPHIGTTLAPLATTPSGIPHNHSGNFPPSRLHSNPASNHLPFSSASPVPYAASPALSTNPTYSPPRKRSRWGEELSSSNRPLSPLSPPMTPQANPNVAPEGGMNSPLNPSFAPVTPLGNPNYPGTAPLDPLANRPLSPSSPVSQENLKRGSSPSTNIGSRPHKRRCKGLSDFSDFEY